MKILLAILAMTIATQLTRFFPFMLFSKRGAPKWLRNGARLIPGAVMLTLVFASLPLNLSVAEDYLKWASAAAVVVIHLLFRHPLISIFGGTGVYMSLLHFWG